MNRCTTCSVLTAIYILLFSVKGFGQGSTAQISGTVKDQTGAVLPGAEVTAIQTETAISRNTITNETGFYILPNLAVGPYRLEVSLPGFRMFVQTGIELQVNSNPVINVSLDVGQTAEQVEVQANAALVETRSVGVGQLMENQRILELPLNGRQATDLITLSGGAVQTGIAAGRNMPGGVVISISGALFTGLNYSLDGVNFNDPQSSYNMPMPFPDALQEFKVETGGLSAQNGKSSGGSVNAVTKSGTNDFHGSAFDFVRNDLFNARQYFSTTQSTLKRNQFGGIIGGPIVRNKVFFFGGYQGTTIRQDPANRLSFVPTAAMLAGDFTTFASPACNAGRQITLRSPYVNNRIDPALFSKAALALASKLPKTDDACGKVISGISSPENDYQLVGKVDYQWNDKHSIFGRYLWTHVYATVPYTLKKDLLTVDTPGYDSFAQAYVFGHTWLLNAHTVASLRIGVNRTNHQRVNAVYFGAPDLGIPVYDGYNPGYLGMNVSGGFLLGNSSSSNSTFRSTSYQAVEDISLIKGAHQIAVGAALTHLRSNNNSNARSSASFTFNGSETGAGLADFLAGKLQLIDQSTPNSSYSSEWLWAMYGQDTWKATPRVTLNYGLRWEPFLPQTLRDSKVYIFDYEKFRQGVKSTVFNNAPAGFFYPGDPGFPGKQGINARWGHLDPRAGIAWDVKGDGRMSVRASYAYAYDYLPGMFALSQSGNSPPWANRVQRISPPGGFDNPWLGYPGGNPFPLPTLGKDAYFVPAGAFLTNGSYDQKIPAASTWSLSVQRQVGTDWLVSASYLGTNIAHAWVQRPLNSSIYFPGGPCTLNGVTYSTCSTTANTEARRRLTLEKPQEGLYIGWLDQLDDGATQNYQGMLLNVQRRPARGVTVSGNYTWSHCIGYETTGTTGGNAGQTAYQTIDDRRGSRGHCDSDRRQVLNLTAVAETPRFGSPALRVLATGWRLSGIYRASTGQWLNVTSGQDRALNGTQNQRPNPILANPYKDQSAGPRSIFINPAAFEQPALGTIGKVGLRSVQGPSTWQFDLALSRVFQVHESQRLEFRAEAYNVPNSFRPGNPATNFNTANTFGIILTALDPRIMQFALKYVF